MQKQHELPQAFADLGVQVRFLKALQKMSFKQPSDIQEQMIPPALEGHDIVGQARTGTGKTAAFGLPILQQIEPGGRLQAICMVPTRELAVQVTGELDRLASFTEMRVVAVYGGQKVATQIHQLGKKPHFVVGTPGRVMDFIDRGVLSLNGIRFVVLDEVDRMLDIGFRDDIRSILARTPDPHQTILASATIDAEIKRIAGRYMHDPIEVNVSQDRITVDEVDQSYVSVERYDKFRAMRAVFEQEDPPMVIVFTNTKHAARKLAKKFHEAGISSTELHGDLLQAKRDRVMQRFRKHQVRVLVATDLAARGIDVSAISHIINYDIPKDPEIYVHRIGRTGRMGARGIAITFVSADEGKELTNIEMLINREVPQRTLSGFVPRPPREDFVPRSGGRPRPDAPVRETVTATPSEAPKGPPKTLGGRFKTRRRRRL